MAERNIDKVSQQKYDRSLSPEYVEAKEQKPQKGTVDKIVESIFANQPKEPEYKKESRFEPLQEKPPRETYADMGKGKEKVAYADMGKEKVEFAYGDMRPSSSYDTPRPTGLAEIPNETAVKHEGDKRFYDARYIDSTEDILARDQREAMWKHEGKRPNESTLEATYRKVTAIPPGSFNPVDAAVGAKGYLSETKLKWEASKYGITPKEFDAIASGKGEYVIGKDGNYKLVKGRTLADVRGVIDQGRAREAALKRSEALNKESEAKVKSMASQATKRYAEAERIEATIPKGGRKLVQFGWEEGSFGQVPTYVNAAGTHGQIRSQFVPDQAAGVKSAIARNRLVMAQMRATAVPRSYGRLEIRLPGGVPSEGGFGAPPPSPQRTIALLSPNKGYTPRSGYAVGPSILQKLGAVRRR